MALLLLVVAAETYAHRTFDPDTRYQFLMTAFALLIAWLGTIPLLNHVAPRLGRAVIIGWLSFLLGLVVVGFVTKP